MENYNNKSIYLHVKFIICTKLEFDIQIMKLMLNLDYRYFYQVNHLFLIFLMGNYNIKLIYM